jgi:hypothetical protein
MQVGQDGDFWKWTEGLITFQRAVVSPRFSVATFLEDFDQGIEAAVGVRL